jgi:GNAT superfamily N-acetyltransferase
MILNAEKYQEIYKSEVGDLLREDEFVKKDVMSCLEEFPECAMMVKSDKEILAIGVYTGISKRTSFTLYVNPSRRNEGIGSILLTSLENEMSDKGIEEIICDYKVSDSIRSFMSKKGYQSWFLSNYMVCTENIKPTSQLDISPYKDSDYSEIQHISSEAFHRMRLSVGLTSTLDTPSKEERSSFLEKSEDIFVLRENQEIIAAAMVSRNEIDQIVVSVDKQGMGYGKALLEYTLHKLRDRGFDQITLWAVEGNPAKTLYEKSGFKVVRQHEFVKKKLI